MNERSQFSPHKHTGFTLVELLAVIAIFAIIIALMLPAMKSTTKTLPNFDFKDPLPNEVGQSDRDFQVDKGLDIFNAEIICLHGGGKRLLHVNTSAQANLLNGTDMEIVGLDTGNNEILLAIDTQVSSNTLYGITSLSRVVEININLGKPEATVGERVSLTQPFDDMKPKMVAEMHHFYVDSGGLYENCEGMNEKWLRSDHVRLPSPWFYILPDGNLMQWNPNSTADIPVDQVSRNCYENPEVLIHASRPMLTPVQEKMLVDADKNYHFYRPSADNYSYNSFGNGERWIKGEVGKKSTSGRDNPWFIVTKTGVFEWDGPGSSSGARVPGLTGLEEMIYNDPWLLYDANLATAPHPKYETRDQLHRFFFDRADGLVRNLWEDGRLGQDWKWFRGANSSYFYIKPSGDLFRWSQFGTDLRLDNLGPDAWDNVEQVVNGFHRPGVNPASRITENKVVDLDLDRGLFRDSADSNYYYNCFGIGEKWFRGDRLKKKTGRTNPWYFIIADGSIFEWDGGNSHVTSQRVFKNPDLRFEEAWRDPNWLCDAYADGSVLSNARPVDPYGELSTSVPAGPPGDYLNKEKIVISDGYGADIDPTTHKTTDKVNDGRITLVAGNGPSYTINVRNGLTQKNPPVDRSVYLLAGIAFDDAGDAFVIDHITTPDEFSEFEPPTGALAPVGDLDQGIAPFDDYDVHMGLEIQGDGNSSTPGNNGTIAVLTVTGNCKLFQINRNGIFKGNAIEAYGAGELGFDSTNALSDITDITLFCP